MGAAPGLHRLAGPLARCAARALKLLPSDRAKGNLMRSCVIAALAGLVSAVACGPTMAWGPGGHQAVGALAQKLIAGTHAGQEARRLLGGMNLAQVSVWADCAKGVSEQTLRYESAGRYEECRVFENQPGGTDRMVDFVRRNLANCEIHPGEEKCHRRYHYTDVSVKQSQYRAGLAGTRDDDVVAAIVAAVRVLKEPAANTPSCAHPNEPLCFASKAEALMVLVHYVGDLHQPLHVGAIYLDSQGRAVNPDQDGLDPATSTRGGNKLVTQSSNLHKIWDSVPQRLTATQVDAAWVEKARAVPRTAGNPEGWPAEWASDSLGEAKRAFDGVTFHSKSHGLWPIELPADYTSRIVTAKETQLTAGGAHLAQLLQDIWP